MREAEEFWDELLAQIEAGQVMSVVGPELLTVPEDGRRVPVYPLIAKGLLGKYGLTVNQIVLRPHHELNDAVCALVERGKRVQDLYRPIHDLLKTTLSAADDSSLQPLRTLASISGFGLFVTTTPDDLLARAIDAERHGGAAKTESIVFAPKLASGTLVDLPEVRSSGYIAVCHLFGKASTSPFVFAIHDEDTLEFIHNLQLNGPEIMKRLFSELRTQSLLLIGCEFPDWLSRFFIRLSNTQRLADARSKREFVVDQSAESVSLTLFLERFSPDSWVLPGSANDFVTELARRWHERHPQTESPTIPMQPSVNRSREDTFFLSYSRTDAAAAKTLIANLQAIGADLIWFDEEDLAPGDEWPQKITRAINSCYLFLALVSSSSEERSEAYFRKEWKLARDRADGIQGQKFLQPIVIDREYDGNAKRYALAHERFPSTQFSHAPDGIPSDQLRDELTRLIRERRSQRAA